MIIEGNKITADEGKVLIRIADNLCRGKEFNLGWTFWLHGKQLKEPKQEFVSDFTEITDEEYNSRIKIDDMAIPINSNDYSQIVDTLVKVKYSPEDQIAILCNYQLNINNNEYIKEYNDMQYWRSLSKELAKCYLNNNN